MSLLNLIVHPHRAYLVTDSAYFGEGGAITRFAPKAVILPRVGVALATAGILTCEHLSDIFLEHEYLPQAEFLKRLPTMARAAAAKHGLEHARMRCDRFVPDLPGSPIRQSIVAFVGYSWEFGRAFGGVFVTHDQPGLTAYRILSREVVLSPLPASIERSILRSPEFDPFTDSLELIEQQRRHNFGSPDEPMCGIAGDIEVLAATKQGFELKRIHTFAGEVGEAPTLPN